MCTIYNCSVILVIIYLYLLTLFYFLKTLKMFDFSIKLIYYVFFHIIQLYYFQMRVYFKILILIDAVNIGASSSSSKQQHNAHGCK